MKKNNTVDIYLNRLQRDLLSASQKTITVIAGRGTGKTFGIGFRTRMALGAMPRGKIFFSSTTYNQLLTKTLPEVQAAWSLFGLKEYNSPKDPGHYVIGRRPPPQFNTPYKAPKKFSNIITFWNGFTIELLSMDRPDLARGGSYDGGEIDEAALVKREHVTKVLLPAIRGNRHFFNTYMHGQLAMYTSMPWKTSGQWVLDYEAKAKAMPDKYYYREATAFENIDVLGQEGIDRLREEMTPLEFEVEVMNQRITRTEDAFYHKFDDDIHIYEPKYIYDEDPSGVIVKGIEGHNRHEVIDLSFDFSGWFNGLICWQQRDDLEYAFDSFFVKEDNKINELVDLFTDAYKSQEFKFVRIWGEPRGWDRNATGPEIYRQIQDRLARNGWGSEILAQPARAADHVHRHYSINEILSETGYGLPKVRFNIERCKDVIIAMKITQVTPDFKKNKSKEKDRNYPQEHAPHFTDMVDYYLLGKHGHKIKGGGSLTGVPNTVIFR